MRYDEVYTQLLAAGTLDLWWVQRLVSVLNEDTEKGKLAYSGQVDFSIYIAVNE
jgi:hypothetical protein